jgi:hypothetical protein
VDLRLETSAVQRQLASLVRSEVRRADRTGGELTGIAKRAADALGPGQHTVDEIVDRAISDAMRIWARFNPRGGQDGKYLSKQEIAELKRADPELGEKTERAAAMVRRRRAGAARVEVSVSSPVPGIRLETRGDRYTVHATAEVPQATRFTMTIAGNEYNLIRNARGILPIDVTAPEGHGVEHVESKNGEGDVSVTFRIVRDPPGSLSTAQALVKAKAAIVEHLKNERMQDDDWNADFPQTWEEAVARGIMDSIDRFADPAHPATELGRKMDRYLFSGRGPLDLHTEVEIAKKDGKVLHILVEID